VTTKFTLAVRSRSASRKPRMRKRQRRPRWQNLRRPNLRAVQRQRLARAQRLVVVVGSVEWHLPHRNIVSTGLAFSAILRDLGQVSLP
jgi:hypothetical protein